MADWAALVTTNTLLFTICVICSSFLPFIVLFVYSAKNWNLPSSQAMLRWCGWFCRLQAGWLRVLGDITINKHCLLFKFASSQRSKRIFCFMNQCASGWNINISMWRKREYRFNPRSVCEIHFSFSGNTWLLPIDMGPSDHSPSQHSSQSQH